MLNLSSKTKNYGVLRPIFTRFASSSQKNYYQILDLQNNCTHKEIREAFIRLSKEHHPDTKAKMDTPITHHDSKEFLPILEAYKVLSKPDSRAAYDFELAHGHSFHTVSGRPGQYAEHRPWHIDPLQYKNPNPGPYYGIKGITKISNGRIVMACLIFAGVGIFCQFIAITNSMTFKRQQLDEHSMESAKNHSQARQNAEKFGDAEQLKRLTLKLDEKTAKIIESE